MHFIPMYILYNVDRDHNLTAKAEVIPVKLSQFCAEALIYGKPNFMLSANISEIRGCYCRVVLVRLCFLNE